jgi:DNA-binding NtrC family response regulator
MRRSRHGEFRTSDVEPIRLPSACAHLVLLGPAPGARAEPHPRLVPVIGSLEVGRRPSSRGPVLAIDDRRVSSRHARITRAGGRYLVDDLGSRNGTMVDGLPVTRAALEEGALLFVGGQVAVFRHLGDEALEALAEERRRPFGPVPTASGETALAIRKLRRLAPTAQELTIVGETGTGKEVYARAVHAASGRAGRFVALNCATLPTELVESEVFGYSRGAHSQAASQKRGLIEEADGGTLFLDEIADMPPATQGKLLRFLQDREFLPLGSTQPRRVDVRIIAAMAEPSGERPAGGLRRDLLTRLGAQPIRLPPLRQRIEDLGALIDHFLGVKVAPRPLEIWCLFALCLHRWPGNVRELDKVLTEAVILANGEPSLRLEHLPPLVQTCLAFGERRVPEPRRAPRPAPSSEELSRLLERHGGSVADVARDLDRHWPVVWRWIKRYGLNLDQFRARGGAAPAGRDTDVDRARRGHRLTGGTSVI